LEYFGQAIVMDGRYRCEVVSNRSHTLMALRSHSFWSRISVFERFFKLLSREWSEDGDDAEEISNTFFALKEFYFKLRQGGFDHTHSYTVEDLQY
jgi:hypothetical protein